VPAGTVTVTEGSEAPAYALAALVGVSAYPVGALTAENLATGTATFTVTAGLETTGVFLNVTQDNFIKVCKVLLNNQGTLAGTSFSYTVNWTFTPPTKNLTFPSYSGTEQVVVVAVAAPGQQCSVPGPIPAGSTVWVTENGAEVAGAVANPGPNGPYVSVSDVSITPSTFAVLGTTAPATTAVLTVPPVGDGLADATFTNTPMGTIEVCKYFVSPYSAYNNGINSATFIVTAGSFTSAPFTVLGGECSPAMIVPAGTATVQETSASSVINGVDESADYYLENITATATVSGLNGGTQNELTSVGTANPASVNVLYGGVASETAVTFTNGVDPTHFKICKQTTSPQLVGAQFTFLWSYKGAIGRINGNPWFLLPEGGTVSLTIKAVATPVCSDLLTDIPVVNPDGSSNQITVLEEAATENVIATAVTLSGAGTVVGDPSVPTEPDTSACLTFDPGYGISIVTFTNEYYPSPV
jgi:hypothetical protein